MSDSYLEWCDENNVVQRRRLVDKLFFGRICRGVDTSKCIRIDHPAISRDHAVIQITPRGIEVTDISTNGTWVNGVRMAPGGTRRLENGDTIELGEMTYRLVAPAMVVTPAEQGWEDRTETEPSILWVTSLVADVRGFSAMCQRTDSRKTYGLIKEVFLRFSKIVSAHKGTVKESAGDAVFAFWEHAKGISSQQALLACKAAMAQERQVDEIRKSRGRNNTLFSKLRLGWGITTGPATLSNYGTSPAALAVVGDCINLAFRLSATANKKIDVPILLDRQTAELVGKNMLLSDLGRIPTKGREGLEQIYGLVT